MSKLPKPLLVVGDIHHHVDEAETIMQNLGKDCTIVQVGDVFDDFNDTPTIAAKSAKWLKGSLAQKNRIHLLGNHDLPYAPNGKAGTDKAILYPCPGFDREKDKVVNKVLNPEEWEKMRLYHYEHGWFFTHAGLHTHWFEHPIKGASTAHILSMLNQAESDLQERIINPIIGAVGFSRGGRSRVGGILWLDHFREASPMEGTRQAYGHTPQTKLSGKIIESKNGININLDNGLSEVLKVYPDGTYEFLKTGIRNYYSR